MAVAFVQSAQSPGGAASAFPIALPNPVATGDLVVVGAVNYSANPTSVTDNYGNAYALIANFTTNGGVALYYAKNVTGSGGLSNFTVTVHFASTEFAWAAAHDVSGADTTAPLDQNTLSTGTGGTPAAGPVTTTANGEYIFAIFEGGVGSVFSGAGAGFTQREVTAGGLFLTEDQIQPTAGSISATFAPVGAGVWATGVATFKALPATMGNIQPIPLIAASTF